MKVVRGLWKILVGIKDGLVLLFMLLFFGGLAAALSLGANPRASGPGALVIDLDGTLVEQPADVSPFAAYSGDGPTSREYRLRDVVRALDGAGKDDAVKAVVLDLDRFTGGGQAAIETIGAAIDGVKRAGKPVLTYATGYTDDGYQLAAHASEAWLDPIGAVVLTGPGGPHLYYKGLLDKIGVVPKVYRVGRFKSFVEPFTRTEQSPEAREANQALADSLWTEWQDDVRKARPKAQLAAYVGRPGDLLAAARGDGAKAALDAGLVDHLGDRTAFGAHVARLAGDPAKPAVGGYAAIPLAGWIAAHPEPTGGDGIGVVTIAGDIVDGKAGPGTAAGDTISTLILKALAEKKIKALVVRVDSPGGSVTASERIRSAIMQAKAAKLPVAVSMGSVAASGGYWVSTPADRIFAEPATITGSIGVFGIIPTFPAALAKLGLTADGVATTPLSGQPDVYRGTSPVFDQVMQLGIDNMYARFVGLVAASRKLTPARVDEIAQGRVWAGGTARQIGLVDQYGGVDDAIAWAAQRAGLDPSAVHPVYIERPPSSWKTFLAGLGRSDDDGNGQGDDAHDAWSRAAARPRLLAAQTIADLRRMATGSALQARCLECPVAPGAAVRSDAGLIRLALGWLAR